MIKIVFCLRRLPELPEAEFYRYWLESHGELVRQYAQTLRIRRYTQSHTFTDARLSPAIDSRGGPADPFDGVAELWWDSAEDLIEAASTPEGVSAGLALLEDERTFIDLANSPMFFSNEHVVLGQELS